MSFSFKGSHCKAVNPAGRTVKKLIADDKWFPCSFSNLKPGDVFQLFDNNRLYTSGSGHHTFLCESLPFEQFGVLAVECSPYAQDKVPSSATC